MKKINSLIILTFSVALLCFSCKDDEESKPSTKQLLTAGSSKDWKITAIEGKSSAYSFVTIDIFNNTVSALGQVKPVSDYGIPEFPACAKDNIVVFNADKTYTINEGASVCTSAYALKLTSGTWALSEDKKILTLTDATGVTFKYEVTTLTEDTINGNTAGTFNFQGQAVDYIATTTFVAVK